ncbi:SecDF P1 head subdomain-containing protein [Stenotrophomonas forensis]|uniref:SecDF P1 head subdomain-containing protein n=1 Tax=Stenotrophomonas forensis TaxID=2871169 RepID=UPI0036D689A7
MPSATPAMGVGADRPPLPGVDVRLSAVDAAGKGVPVQWQDEKLTLREPPLARSADIADVRAVQDEYGQTALQIRYRPEAHQRIHDGTAAMVGQRMAISVDGRVLMVATVQGPFAESMNLSGLTGSDAEALEKHITGSVPVKR